MNVTGELEMLLRRYAETDFVKAPTPAAIAAARRHVAFGEALTLLAQRFATFTEAELLARASVRNELVKLRREARALGFING